MATPSPNGPTINDLQYQSFTPAIPFAFSPQVYDQAITKENVVVNLANYSGTVDTSDFVSTAENVQVAIDQNLNNQFSINVSDTTVTSEAWDPSKQPGGVRVVTVADTTVTSENIAVTEA